jgi:hypothetical protein
VKHEFEKEGFICFEDQFDRDRPDMVALREDKLLLIELRTTPYDIETKMKLMIRKKDFYEKLSKRKVEYCLIIPRINEKVREKLERLGIRVMERPLLRT